MITVNIRKQGGAAVMTIPADILRMLNVGIGAAVEIKPAEDGFLVRPIQPKPRRKYTVQELMRGVSREWSEDVNRETAWVREGGPVGRELA